MLKNTCLIIVICAISTFLQAQNVETPAQFPMGLSGFYRYFNSHLKTPRSVQRLSRLTDIDGVAQFTIDTSGRAINMKIIDNISPEMDAQVLRVLRGMPLWKPATKNGIAVSSEFSFPYSYARIGNGSLRIPLDVADTLPYKWALTIAFSGGIGFQNKDLGRLLNTPFPIFDMDYDLSYKRYHIGLGVDGFSMTNKAPIMLAGKQFNDKEDVLHGSFDMSFGYHLLDNKRFRLTPIIAAKFNFLSISPDLGLADNPAYEATTKSLELSLQADWFLFRFATLQNGHTDLTRFGLRTRLSIRPLVYKEKLGENARMSTTFVQLTMGIIISGKFYKNK